ncbi:MAG TPA: YncE family protein [Methylomirabilota bacterium]|nr:YncE family protein [Methylomirabilota bacterium]
MKMERTGSLTRRGALLVALISLLVTWPMLAHGQLMVIGNDEKVGFDKNANFLFQAPGKDSVSIVDISNREAPKIVANLPLMNSIFGPPTNLAITPDQKLALVANPMDWEKDGEKWKPVPDNKLYVIDLTTNPPTHIATVQVGKQPSGLSINAKGDLALIACRADNSISVVSILGKEVKPVGTVAMGEQVAHVVFTPDGKRALAAKFPGHKIALLDVDGQKVTYNKYDMNVGLWPYNVDVSPLGTIALTADNGNGGRSDGNVDTVSVIDLEATPPRVIDRVVVGDAPEGLAISPKGDLAAVMLLHGNDAAWSSWFYNRTGSVVILKIDYKTVTKLAEIEVRGLPEGAVWSPDGKYLYVGNYMDRDVSILKVEETKKRIRVVNTGKSLKLPGQPASMRGRNQ